MADTAGSTRAPVGALLAILGGALLAAGSFMTWAEVSGGGTSVTAKGVDGSDGYITAIAGVIALVCGAVMMKQSRRALAILVLLAGLVGGAVGVYDALTAKDSVLDSAAEELAPQVGATAEEVRTLLDQAIDAGEISISISIGLYIVVAGGVIAMVGGFLSMRGGRETEAVLAGFSGTAVSPEDAPTMPAGPAADPPPAPPGGDQSG